MTGLTWRDLLHWPHWPLSLISRIIWVRERVNREIRNVLHTGPMMEHFHGSPLSRYFKTKRLRSLIIITYFYKVLHGYTMLLCTQYFIFITTVKQALYWQNISSGFPWWLFYGLPQCRDDFCYCTLHNVLGRDVKRAHSHLQQLLNHS